MWRKRVTTTLQLPEISEEDALGRLIAFLRQRRQPEPGRSHSFVGPDGEHVVSVLDLIDECLEEERRSQNERHPVRGMRAYQLDHVTKSAPFYDAVWMLYRRGVLRLAQLPEGASSTLIGTQFTVTAYGKEWLERTSGYEAIPEEFGRFGQLLRRHAPRFGEGYHVRSQEAVACYRAHTYLACCAMCGASAESVTLALAIARAGDEETVLAEYRRANGRSAIERRLTAQCNAHIQRELGNYLSLLGYWRDEAAHGERSGISESEAFTSLLLLLRFAQFADGRWDDLTVQ